MQFRTSDIDAQSLIGILFSMPLLILKRKRRMQFMENDKITFIDLFEAPKHIPTVAGWIYNEFWLNKDGYSAVLFENLLKDAKDPSKIPLSLLAFVNDAPAGTINLIENDDEQRTHLRPWLAALHICPQFRSRRIGSQLVNLLLNRAFHLNFSEVYLGTDNPGYYERLGAKFYEKARAGLFIMKFHKK